MKFMRMNIIYTTICSQRLSKRKVETVEYLLLLIQQESIELGMKPLICNPIYIDENTVRIKYLSDLLRVRRNMVIHYKGFNGNEMMKKYLKILSKYIKLSDAEIEKKALQLISKDDLDSKYFLYEKYDNIIMRKIARIEANRDIHSIASFIRTFFVTIPAIIISVAILLGFYMIYFESRVDKDISILFPFLLIDSVFIIIFIIWSWIWSKPTEYEINQHNND